MITKTNIRSLYYLDRDTDIDSLVDEMLKVKRSEAIVFLKRQQDRLQEKDATKYFTLEDSLKLKDGELENMMRFFRGAVVPYYIRQSRWIWRSPLTTLLVKECTEEIKRSVGFLKYNSSGHITDEVNSLLTFEKVKDFNAFLTMIEEVCFEDHAYIFPDSEHFKKLEKAKGRDAAQRQVLQELEEKIKNKFPDRKIIN